MFGKRNRESKAQAADLLSRVDLCFVVDTTGSMGVFIRIAQQRLREVLSAFEAEHGIDLAVGLVEYRDHPPQDKSFVTRIHASTRDLRKMQEAIDRMEANGGGDHAEAVFDGIYDACEEIDWRPHSCRFILLVGDAPPHGIRSHVDISLLDGPESRLPANHRRGDFCPCGLTVHSVTGAAERRNITVHAIAMQGDAALLASFGELASGTGGMCVQATSGEKVVEAMTGVLRREFSHLANDRLALETVGKLSDFDTDRIAEALGWPRGQAAASLARLGKRGFLTR